MPRRRPAQPPQASLEFDELLRLGFNRSSTESEIDRQFVRFLEAHFASPHPAYTVYSIRITEDGPVERLDYHVGQRPIIATPRRRRRQAAQAAHPPITPDAIPQEEVPDGEET